MSTAIKSSDGKWYAMNVSLDPISDPTPPPVPTVSVSAALASIQAGASSVLTIAATDTTSITLTGSDGTSYSLPAAGGAQTVSPAATTTYTVTAVGNGGTASATATVTVTAPPPVAPVIPATATLYKTANMPNWKQEWDDATPGSASGSSTFVSDAVGRHFQSTYTKSGGMRHHVTLTAHDVTSHNYCYDVVVSAKDWGQVSRLELDFTHVLADGSGIFLCAQAASRTNGGSGTWEVTSTKGGMHWQKSNILDDILHWPADTPQHICIFTSRDDAGTVTYQGVELNGVWNPFDGNCVVPSVKALTWPHGTLLINFQQEGNGAAGSLDLTAAINCYTW